ncbi:3-deoxy-D-manno-octulosonic acid transferase [Rhodobacteraceae bacterium THAF1]|uniref:3-deoxy-D-manno-octulosonic acid transferase n=1 Tax=Palleronia sp. THAF1 TaxID=2587842 RepID=UPI000F3BEF40|nr:hypothetical protein [Palleronia sp. THAF1]QFU10032.1 3-deoxy-D-manno-octulosonic acid transferase [Palleronia sp. THAF1]VDC17063.1 3-deoxy-D-manno-octulosonic acid transferase [Rhodobacteraceae bacterium THAF1]
MPDLSLTLLRHRLAASRESARRPHPAMASAPRPDGRLLWVHYGAGASVHPTGLVLDRLRDELSDLSILTTGMGAPERLTALAPADTATDAVAFLDHWRPSAALFCGADPFPLLWEIALSRGIPLLAADTDPARMALALVKPMAQFDAVMARAPDPRLGAVVEVSGPFAQVAAPPAVAAKVLQAAIDRIGARPIWLALNTAPEEVSLVLDAHRRAAQMTHRLLLILMTEDDAEAGEALEASGLRWQVTNTAPVAPDTQVILADRDPGLWLRLAPVAFLGGTLATTGPVAPVAMPAGLGAAILTGPRLGDDPDMLQSLLDADGARRVTDADSLGTQVERLLNPEEAAALAHNAWTVTTEGAEASARLFSLLDDTLAGVPE